MEQKIYYISIFSNFRECPNRIVLVLHYLYNVANTRKSLFIQSKQDRTSKIWLTNPLLFANWNVEICLSVVFTLAKSPVSLDIPIQNVWYGLTFSFLLKFANMSTKTKNDAMNQFWNWNAQKWLISNSPNVDMVPGKNVTRQGMLDYPNMRVTLMFPTLKSKLHFIKAFKWATVLINR